MNSIKIIAEIGINHNGSYEIAKLLIKAAKDAGCSAIKFQYRNLSRAYANLNSKEIGDGLLQSEISRCYLKTVDLIDLTKYAKRDLNLGVGISFFCKEDIDDFGNNISLFDFFKVPSVEFSNRDLVKTLTYLEKKILLSLGCNNEEQIKEQINYLDENNSVLMHCVSNYPVEIFNSKLGYLKHLRKIWNGEIGYSSHDKDWKVCIAAMTLGIDWLERHITLDKEDEGLDHSTSSTPREFKDLCFYARELKFAMEGNGPRTLNSGELINLQNLGRSPYLIKKINKGSFLNDEDFHWRSPQVGLNNNNFKKFKNFPIQKSIEIGQAICKFHFEEENNYKFDYQFLNSKKISLPSRIHDSKNLFEQSLLKYQELHLSFEEVLSDELLNITNYSDKIRYSIHLPDYISSNCIIDPFSRDNDIKNKSLKIIEKCINLSVLLHDLTGLVIPIVGSFSRRYSSRESDIKMINDFCLDKTMNGINCIMPQCLPPIAWYFGGSVKLDIFNSIRDFEIIREISCNYCLDISHAFMCSYLYEDILDEILKSKKLIKHIHIAGASSIDGEGESLDKMSKKQIAFLNQIINIPCIKVLEVWQGHLNNYGGFKEALHYLPKLIE
tara:strand:- start:445 stop:2274 length:1830 start_codon:yes stop_codon:yes gene_type:complete